MIIPANGSVGSHDILACRLETSPGENLTLDGLVLEWIGFSVEPFDAEFFLRNSLGLVGNMTGALRLLGELFPHAHWNIGPVRAEPGSFDAVLVPAGGGPVFTGRGLDPANALLAALVRGFAFQLVRQPLRA